MKKGLEYSVSREKRAFDVTVSSLLLPAEKLFGLMLQRHLAIALGEEVEPVIEQERTGKGQLPFQLKKFLTLHPVTDEPISRYTAAARRLGVDELAQIANIRNGTMSVVGHRPLLVAEYEETLDCLPPKLGNQWRGVVDSRLPGMNSSFAIHSHSHAPGDRGGPEVRADMDIRDAHEDSMRYDIALTAQLLGTVISRKLH